jgi:hypothetical protein
MIETINLGLYLILLSFGIGVVDAFRKVDLQLLKARMFLRPELMRRKWVYSTTTGAFFVLYGFLSYLKIEGREMLMTLLIVAFYSVYLQLVPSFKEV